MGVIQKTKMQYQQQGQQQYQQQPMQGQYQQRPMQGQMMNQQQMQMNMNRDVNRVQQGYGNNNMQQGYSSHGGGHHGGGHHGGHHGGKKKGRKVPWRQEAQEEVDSLTFCSISRHERSTSENVTNLQIAFYPVVSLRVPEFSSIVLVQNDPKGPS